MGCAASSANHEPAPLASSGQWAQPAQQAPGGGPMATNSQTTQAVTTPQSTQPVKPVPKPVEPVPEPVKPVSKPVKGEQSKGILISCHSANNGIADQVAQSLSSRGFDPLTITESSPAQLDTRAGAVGWAPYVLIVASFKYQRNQTCMELANFAKDNKKPLLTIVVQPNYRPSGALGALAISGGKAIDFRRHADQGEYEKSVETLVRALESKSADDSADRPSKPAPEAGEQFPSKFQDVRVKGSGIFISYHADAVNVARMVSTGSGKTNSLGIGGGVKVTLGNPSSDNLTAIKQCGKFIAIMSSGYMNSEKFQEEFECARATHKKIIPVNGAKGFRPAGWLALAIAGKLYYVLQDEGQAYAAHRDVPDSNPMNDFIFAVFAEDPPPEEEVEKAEIAALTKQLDEARAKLDSWPPPRRPIDEGEGEELPALTPEDLEPKSDADLLFNYIHHEVTRMSFNAPKPLFDERGVPIKQKFDVMLSYQWDIQPFVRDVYMDLDIRNFRAWMDIWGGMLGNINSAMATAVETSSVLLAFLTERYQKSVNCNLELKYAMERKKPIIFIKAERDLVLRDWIQDIASKSLVFEMSSIQDAGIKDGGVPRINRISEAIRKLATWEAKRSRVRDDVSEEVFRLQDQLDDALHQIHKDAGTKRFETCTRCEVKFDENSADGCKKHSAYFMGGTIIAGRWVCCQQRDKNSPGCQNAKHINLPRKFTEMSGHDGCFEWDPEWEQLQLSPLLPLRSFRKKLNDISSVCQVSATFWNSKMANS